MIRGLLLLIFVTASLGADDSCEKQRYCALEPTLLIDPYLSMYSGSESLYTGYRVAKKALCYLDCHLEPPILGTVVRTAQFLLIEYPLLDLVHIVQHEYFGHGARAREFGLRTSYQIDAPFPYGDGRGATVFSQSELNALSRHKNIALDAAGVEANRILGQRVGWNVFVEGCLDDFDSLFYLITYHDLTNYILNPTDPTFSALGNDMGNYVRSINELYGKDVTSISKLKKGAYLNLIDPLTWASIWSLGRHLYLGEKCSWYPEIGLGSCRFLPSAMMTLAPYGVEYGVHSYASICGHLFSFYGRGGETCGLSSWTIGGEIPSLCECRGTLIGLKGNLWVQPALKSNPLQVRKREIGIHLALRLLLPYNDYFGWFLELGGKTSGFVPGEPLDADLMIRGGMSLFCF